jgi:hypothetical protein
MATIPRRYKNPKHPEYRAYNDEFDRLLLNSKIFNQGDYPTVSSIYWDRQRIISEIEIAERELIPALTEKLTECQSRFEAYCTQQENEGHDRPEAWPQHLLAERCRIEAQIDISKREAEFLRAKLEELYLKPEAQKTEDDMLAYGPIGVGKLRDGVLSEIDGQPCGFTAGGILIITKGRFAGLRVKDYRQHVVAPYVDARNRRLRELTEQRLAQIRERGTSNITIRTSLRKVDKSTLPPWPEGVKNYLAEETKAEEGNEKQ